MTPCSGCHRHLRLTDTTCPFCGTGVSAVSRALNAVGGAVTALVLAACYGSPSMDKPDDTGLETGVTDLDVDGYAADVDCDDNNAAINPGATEVCDDTLDNDCDTKTDAEDEDCAAAK